MRVELIYDADCPNIALARAQLLKAFSKLKKMASWIEWDRADPAGPDYIQDYGSPTILVNGQDVTVEPYTESSNCCRLYHNGKHYQGVPPLSVIQSALATYQHIDKTSLPSKPQNSSFKFKSGLAGIISMLPSIAAAIMPKLFCPACWPAYSGLLSALGVGFINYTPYLLPLTISFLIIAVGTLAYRAGNRHGYKPLYLGMVAAMLVVLGKFVYESDNAMYTGIALLVIASIWNAWPSTATQKICSSCQTHQTTLEIYHDDTTPY